MPKRFRLGHFRRFRLLLASMLALLAGPFMPGFLNAADVLVVCPPEFRPALAPWLTHREGQGHQIELLSNRGTSADIQARIRQSASQQPVKFVLLVGDAGPAASESGAPRSQATAAGHIEAKVNVLFGSEPHICTDNGYADLDDDGVPDLAVGRLTADSPAELETIVQKILHYETQTGYGAWRQKIHFVGGLGGFGPLIDAAMEQWARRLITEGVPAAYATSMTYGSWQSPYCPAPPRFQQTTLDRLNEGGLFWIYMGHGSIRHVDAMRVPTAAYPILRAEDMPRLANRGGPPIALFLSCYSGAFDARQDCLAEELLRTDGGPVAVVCGSRVTMPYAMTVFGNELMQECFQAQRATLGELLLHAKRNTMLKGRDDDFSRGMDAAARCIPGRR
ncbi:MAG: C25 family cysteine peptidase, partial [Pirellulales bacterium]